MLHRSVGRFTNRLFMYLSAVPDLFISHASEDKELVARPLYEALKAQGLDVWLDESELTLGDSLRQKIEEGLRSAGFGVVILSHSFFREGKYWTGQELDGLFAREEGGKKVILPVWYQLTVEDVREYSPLLAARLGVRWEDGLEAVVAAILRAIRVEPSTPATPRQGVDSGARSNVVIRVPDDGPMFFSASRIAEGEGIITMEIGPRTSEERAYLRDLRNKRPELFVAFGDDAMVARVLEIKSEYSGDAERISVSFERQEPKSSWMEASYNGISADRLAEMRAKMILLDERPWESGKSDIERRMLESMIRGGGSNTLEAHPLTVGKSDVDAPELVEESARLRLLAVLELVLSNCVEHVLNLDLKLGAGEVRVEFVGRRHRRYQNEEPATVRVQGTRRF